MDAAMALQSFLSLGFTAAFFLLLFGIGSFILEKASIRCNDPLLRLCMSIGIGFCLIGNAMTAANFLHVATPIAIRIASIALCILFLPYCWGKQKEILGIGKSVLKTLRASHPVVAICFISLISGYLALAVLPPTDFDSLMYHLAVVKLWLSHGGFFNVFFNPQADFPMLTEMVSMIGLAWGNDIICKTMSVGISFVLFGAIAVMCKNYCGTTRIVIPSLLIFLTFTNTITNMPDWNVDTAQALWTLLAVFCMDRFIETDQRRNAVCAGLFAGMAMQTKIFGVFVLAVLAVQGVVAWRQCFNKKKLLQGFAVVVLIAICCGLPWYCKSYLFKSTILSMSSHALIDNEFNSPLGIETHTGIMFLLINSVGRLVSCFWSFTLFLRHHRADTFGPLLLVVLPFACFIKIPQKVMVLFYCAASYFVCILGMEMAVLQSGSSIRYCGFILAVASVLISWTISRLSELPKIKRMLQIMVVVMVFLGATLFVKRYNREWKALFTNMPRDAYLSSVLPEYPVILSINSLSDKATVMPIYNFSNYYLDVPYIAAYRNYASVQEMKKDFMEKNIRYIFANDKLDTAANAGAFPQILKKQCIAKRNGFYLFKIDLNDF